jgi:threonine dehydratase
MVIILVSTVIKTSFSHRPTLKDFREAQQRINEVAIHTPIVPLRRYKEEETGIYLKPENIQPIGSYKIRGVYNWAAQLPADERKKGFSTISAGNMSQAVGYVANIFGVPSRAIMFNYTPASKIEACKKYGMEVILLSWEEVMEYLKDLPDDRCFLHPLEEYLLLDGHGTIGLEIMEDMPDTETIYVALGAGFLGTGTALAAKALNPSVKVIGVNSVNYPHFYESFKRGKPVEEEHLPTLADGTGGLVTDHMLGLVRDVINDVVVVPEDKIADSIRYLALENKLVVEGAGALSLAAALMTPKSERGKTVCVLSGGSIDAETLNNVISKTYTR